MARHVRVQCALIRPQGTKDSSTRDPEVNHSTFNTHTHTTIRAPLWTGLPAWGNLSGSPTYSLPLGTGRQTGKGLRTLCQDEAGPLPVVAQARPGARP